MDEIIKAEIINIARELNRGEDQRQKYIREAESIRARIVMAEKKIASDRARFAVIETALEIVDTIKTPATGGDDDAK